MMCRPSACLCAAVLLMAALFPNASSSPTHRFHAKQTVLAPQVFIQLSSSDTPVHRVHNVAMESVDGQSMMTQLDETFSGDAAEGYTVHVHYTVDPAESIFPKAGISEAVLKSQVLNAAAVVPSRVGNETVVGRTPTGVTPGFSTKIDMLVYASKSVGVDALAAVKSDILSRLRNHTRTCFCRVEKARQQRRKSRSLDAAAVRRTAPRFFSQIVENPPLDKLTERALRGGASDSPSDTGAVDQPDPGGGGARSDSDSPQQTPWTAASTPLQGLNASCSCFVNATSLGAAEPVPPPPKIDRDAAKRYRYGCAATTLCHKPVDDAQLLLALDAGDRDSIGIGRKRWWRLAENKLFMTLASEAAVEARKPAAPARSTALNKPARPTRWFDVTSPQSSSSEQQPRQRLEGKLLNRVDFVKSADAANRLTGGPPGLDPRSRRLPLATVGGGALHFSFKRGLPPLRQPPGVSVAGLDISPSVFPDLSIEVWVNLDENSFAAGGPDLALPNSGFAVGCGDYTAGSGRRAVLLHDKHFSAVDQPHVAIDAGAPYLSNLDPLAPRNWHHVVAVWQQGGFSFVYVNGVQRSVASTFTTNSECNLPLWVGHTAFTSTILSSTSPNMTSTGHNGNVTTTNSSEARAKAAAAAAIDDKEEAMPADFGSGIEGFIGLVRVFGRTLSAVEVQTLFQRGEQRFPD